ncbi:hypothetical protein CKA32_006971 [Geitlerinema sp. FC II]|nr:hypothetical protein CKA32_006971 [Geitlerinema sp. FC II]
MWVRLNRVNLVDLADNTDRYLLKKGRVSTSLSQSIFNLEKYSDR